MSYPHTPARALAVERGMGACISPDGALLFTTQRDSHGVAVVDTATGETVRVLGGPATCAGLRKACYASDPDTGEGSVWVADQGNNCVHRFRVGDGSATACVGKGSLEGPHGVAVLGPLLFVTEWTLGRLTALDYAADAVVWRAGTGILASPCGIALPPASPHILVVDQGHNRLCVFTREGEFVRAEAEDAGLAAPGDVALLRPPSPLALIADKGNNRVCVYDREAGAVVGAFPAPGVIDSPTCVVLSPSGALFVTQRETNACHVFT